MRIKCLFTDYYDYAVQGDYNIYYDRKQTQEDVNINIPTTFKTISFLSYDNMSNLQFSNNTDGLYSFGILKIGYKTYPFILIKFLTSDYKKKLLYFYNYETFINFIADKINQHHLEKYMKHINEFKSFFTQDLSNVLVSDEPITVYYLYRQNQNVFREIHKNVSLVDIMFHLTNNKVEEIYQDIETFINNKNTEKTVIIKDDKVIRDSKGFDNQSFKS